MIRRSALAAGALVVALTLSSCSTFNANNEAARVGSTTFQIDDFQTYMHDYLAANDPTADSSQIDGETARGLLSNWVGDQLIIQFLSSKGIQITDADRTPIATQLDSRLQAAGVTISDSTHDLVVESGAARTVFQNSQVAGALGPFAKTVDVVVDSRYGYWDADTGAVVPFE
ncbi:MAG: hypothetical protein JWN99_2607 [Ilumatobacteraceae bacterium]|nr:hypothetical protein [Ilumatobacteraceae bacterium]